jgi:hypothetical protein
VCRKRQGTYFKHVNGSKVETATEIGYRNMNKLQNIAMNSREDMSTSPTLEVSF